MKTIFTFLFSSIFFLSSFSREGTRMTITSVSTNKLQVEIDGRRYQMSDKGISIRDLRSGFHTVKIYREQQRKNKFRIFGNGYSRQEIIYNNRINLREGHHFDILVNRFGKVFIDERRIDRNEGWFDDDDDNFDNNRDRSKDNRDNRYENTNGRVMSDQEFRLEKENLQNEWMENKRMKGAMRLLDKNYFLSRQVKEIVQLFNSENNKLDLAKHAYSRTADKNVYYIVNDVFTFNSSREELAGYIRDNK